MTEALSKNFPATGRVGNYTGTGAVSGDVFAVPFRAGGYPGRFLQIQITFSADPGAYVFAMTVSNDVNGPFVEAPNGSQITGTTVPGFGYFDAFRFIRVDQVSKANAVTATVSIVLL